VTQSWPKTIQIFDEISGFILKRILFFFFFDLFGCINLRILQSPDQNHTISKHKQTAIWYEKRFGKDRIATLFRLINGTSVA
jgi:hypothetical protein